MAKFVVILLLAAAVGAGVFFLTRSDSQVVQSATPTPPATVSAIVATKAAIPASGNRIVFNAIDFETKEGPVELLEETGMAAGKCIFVPDTVLGKPVKLLVKLHYKFKVEKAGEYKVWIRHWWQDECGNSLLLVFDDGPELLFGEDGTVSRWRWPPALRDTVQLKEGEHTLTIIPREDGLKFDQIMLTTDKEDYPTELYTPTK
ncbi:MAG: hypothetical protein WC712_00535 [Candidatus Brocadiia bacterium]